MSSYRNCKVCSTPIAHGGMVHHLLTAHDMDSKGQRVTEERKAELLYGLPESRGEGIGRSDGVNNSPVLRQLKKGESIIKAALAQLEDDRNRLAAAIKEIDNTVAKYKAINLSQ